MAYFGDTLLAWICLDCGHRLDRRRKKDEQIVTMNQAICGWCGEEKGCCAPRNFGYPPAPETEEVTE